MADTTSDIALTDKNGQETNGPVPAANTAAPSKGEPTLPRLARGKVAGTTLALAALAQEHNCDICAPLNKYIATAKAEIMTFVSELRTEIEAMFSGMDSNPAVGEIKQEVTALVAKAKLLRKELQPLVDEAKAIQEYIKETQALIAEIQAASAAAQALLAGCLQDALGGLAQAKEQLTTLSSAPQEALNTAITATTESATTVASNIDSTTSTQTITNI